MSRIEELERRVRQDPASIAFSALAEEYRRAGRLEEAVAACRAGLARHPAYISAHVTLGRALQELERIGEARAEFEYVLSIAPDNLAALRGRAELRGEAESRTPAVPPATAPPIGARVFEPTAIEPVLIERPAHVEHPVPVEPPTSVERPVPSPAASAPLQAPFPTHVDEPDFSGIDAWIDASGASQRAAQIERLEIWLARLQELRGGRDSGRNA